MEYDKDYRGFYTPKPPPPNHKCLVPAVASYDKPGENSFTPVAYAPVGSLWECGDAECGRWWVYGRVFLGIFRWKQVRRTRPIAWTRVTKLIEQEEELALRRELEA